MAKEIILVTVVAVVVALLLFLLLGGFENVCEDLKYRNKKGWHKNPLDGMWHRDMPDL